MRIMESLRSGRASPFGDESQTPSPKNSNRKLIELNLYELFGPFG